MASIADKLCANIKLEKLDENNYKAWTFAMENALKAAKLWKAVKDTDTGSVSDRNERDLKAKTAITSNISFKLIRLVRGKKTSAEMWNAIEAHFVKKSTAARRRLDKELANLKHTDDQPLKRYIEKFQDLMDDYDNLGLTVEEETQCIQFLTGLPKSYSNFTTTYDVMVKPEDLDLDEIISAAEDHELKLRDSGVIKESKFMSKNEAAFMADTRTPGSGNQKGKKGKGKCYVCGKTGHFIRDCREFKEFRQYKARKVEQANLAKEDEERQDYAFLTCERPLMASGWFLDSGASSHMCKEQSVFTKLNKEKVKEIITAGKKVIKSKGQGDIRLKSKEGSTIKLENTLWVPTLAKNLISIPRLTEAGYEIKFKGDIAHVMSEDALVLTAQKQDGLFKVDEAKEVAYLSEEVKKKAIRWHKRLGHVAMATVIYMLTHQVVNGMERNDLSRSTNCEGCVKGKGTRRQFKTPNNKKISKRQRARLQVIHGDVCGPMSKESIGRARYFCTWIDEASSYVVVNMLRTKDTVLGYFKRFKAWICNQTGITLKALQTDNGGEYTSAEFDKYCAKHGIQQRFTAPYASEQHGLAERMNRTLADSARAMLKAAGMPLRFWAEAVHTAAYIRNRVPKARLGNITPYERLLKTKPDISHIRTFGCLAWKVTPEEKRRKLDDKAEKCVLLGYEDGGIYRLWNIQEQRVQRSTNVYFQEDIFPFKDRNSSKEDVNVDEIAQIKEESCARDKEESPRRSSRVKMPVARYMDEVHLALATGTSTGLVTPRNFRQMLKSPQKKEWEKAMKAEYDSLMSMGTWELVPRPENRKIIGGTWAYRIKQLASGAIEKFKARYCAQGFSQVEGVDYVETFAPVAKLVTLRLLLAIAIRFNLLVQQFDIETAFLNGYLEDTIYIEQPDGFKVKGKENWVCRLVRSLYGLKQSPRLWNETLKTVMKSCGLTQSESDPCLFYRFTSTAKLLVLVYVDDLVVAGTNQQAIDQLKQSLKKKFKLKELGDLSWCLGIQITRSQSGKQFALSQRKFIDDILKRFNMTECKPVTTPMEPNAKFVKGNPDEVIDVPYRSVIGSLMYLMLGTRPDIAYAVGTLSKFLDCPTQTHWTAAKRVIRYLQGTKDHGLIMGKEVNDNLTGMVDANWGTDVEDRRSTSGYLFMLMGGLLCWTSKRQSTVALSSTEAEYMALSLATQEAIWLRRLLKELSVEQVEATQVGEDNQGCIALAKNPVQHARTKHIDIRHHFVRQALQEKQIVLQYVPTEEMSADLLTKALPGPQFRKLRDKLNILDIGTEWKC